MKILVPIKRVVDYNVKVRPLGDNSNVDLNNAKMSVNPFSGFFHSFTITFCAALNIAFLAK